MKRYLVLLPLVVALSACGSSTDTTAQHLENLDNAATLAGDKATVARDSVALAKTALNGGSLPAQTVKLTHALRVAASDGASASWINNQIDSAETVVPNCNSCITLLEGARQ